MSPKILVITSTVRENRVGRKVADWYMEQAKKATPEANLELLDIADLDLPIFSEPISPLTADNENKLTDRQKELCEYIDKADGFVIITGEYNHTIPGPLKNFLDYLPPRVWAHKAAAFVGYGTEGAVWSILHLIHVMAYLRVASVIDTVKISAVWAAFDDNDQIKPDNLHGDVAAQLKELNWWVGALRSERTNR